MMKKVIIDAGNGINTKGKSSPDCALMDNQEDCAFLLSAKGRQAIIDLHIDGIISYLNEEEPKSFK